MFLMSCTSISSIVTKGGRVAAVPDIPYAYYTFDVADVTDTSVLNRTSTFYDASLSSLALLDGSNNISGTTDLSLNAASSQFVTINSPMDIGKSTGLSILFWVRYGTTNVNGTRIFDFGNNPTSNNIEVYIDSIGIPFLSIYSGSTPYSYSFGYPLNTNTYKHLGITMAADGTFKYYIDGVLYKTTTGNQYPTAIVRTKNYIGKSSNNALFLNGGVGEIRIYNNVVSSAVVLNDMNTNVRLYNNSFMTHNYRFKYADLQNGKIQNQATGIYDASFLTPVDATFALTSATKQIGITTGTQKNNQATPSVIINSRINSNFLYNLPTVVNTGIAPTGQSADSNYGVQILNGFTTPATGGFSVNFWFYTCTNTSTYNLPFFSFNNGNTTASITSRIAFGVNSAVAGASSSLWVNTVKDATNNRDAITVTTTPGSYANLGWHQYTLIVDYAAQTIRSYIDIDSIVFTHTYLDFSNTTFNYCVLMNDITYASFDYNRPIRGFMDNFRIYNVPLKLSELRQLAQIPVIPAAKVYTLRPMSVAAPVNGNVAVYMNDAASTVYLSAGVGNLYVGNVSTGTWTQSTLASGSSGQLENRNWRDIVCNGTGQYVVACASSTILNDPSGVVFYSSDYGNTFTMTDNSQITTTDCFSTAMSVDGNYTYLNAWGTAAPTVNAMTTVGNIFRSSDRGVTWTVLTSHVATTNPGRVKCNSTGEYFTLGTFGQTGPNLFGNYGNLIMTSFPSGQFGTVPTRPMFINNGSVEHIGFINMGRGNNGGYNSLTKSTALKNSPYTYASSNCTSVPSSNVPQPQPAWYPWISSRNIEMSSNGMIVLSTDTGTSGNVFISTNGVQTQLWFGGAVANCAADFTNLTITSEVPRTPWTGLCVNWNDHFAFANKTGTVYLYSWTLQ